MLVSSIEEGGLLPEMANLIQAFERMIVWKKVDGTKDLVPEPTQGIDDEFDGANEEVNRIKALLQQYLYKIRDQLKDRRIEFSHTKFRYELEIPEETVKGDRKPKNFEFTSNKKGF